MITVLSKTKENVEHPNTSLTTSTEHVLKVRYVYTAIPNF